MKRSRHGEPLARPGYALETRSIAAASLAYASAPPTGTRKFLSVLDTTTSTRPTRIAREISAAVALDCTP
jgi:hypothetical protein